MKAENLQNIHDEIKELLRSTNEFKTIAIGVEKGISHKDCPFVRVVPHDIQNADSINASLPFTVFIGIRKDSDPEENYKKMFPLISKTNNALEHQQIKDGIISLTGTIFDEDLLDNFKVTALQFILRDFNVNY